MKIPCIVLDQRPNHTLEHIFTTDNSVQDILFIPVRLNCLTFVPTTMPIHLNKRKKNKNCKKCILWLTNCPPIYYRNFRKKKRSMLNVNLCKKRKV